MQDALGVQWWIDPAARSAQLHTDADSALCRMVRPDRGRTEWLLLPELAPECRSVLGYDRCPAFVELGRQAASDRGIHNASSIHHDSSDHANSGRVRIPSGERAFDLIVCRKAPFNWIEDATRVARPGATLLMLVPDGTPQTPWLNELPESLRWQPPKDPNWCRVAIESRLAVSGLVLDSWWTSDVPEYFPDAEQLYVWRAWRRTEAEVPPFSRMRADLERLFSAHATAEGLGVRLRHVIWKATVPTLPTSARASN